MTWRFTGKNANGDAAEPYPGLPLEAEDKEFAAAVKAVGLQLKDIEASGLYAHKDAPPPKAEDRREG